MYKPFSAPPISVLITGGTFDKSYDVVAEKFSFAKGSALPELIDRALISDVETVAVMLIDSLDMRREHRGNIATAVEEAINDRVVIIHGTSLLLETAIYLQENFSEDKTIVLTGALKPARYDFVEAACNFGAAIAAARYMPPGVYVAMHGLVAKPQNLHKESDTGRFVLVAEDETGFPQPQEKRSKPRKTTP
jgi:L-asparaginase